jgi:psiF repeat
MNNALGLLLLMSALVGTAAMGGLPGSPPDPQQQLEQDCDTAAIGKSGLERSSFLDDCRKNGVHAAIVSPASDQKERARQQKTRDCNTQADMQKLSGPPRTTFLNVCVGN